MPQGMSLSFLMRTASVNRTGFLRFCLVLHMIGQLVIREHLLLFFMWTLQAHFVGALSALLNAFYILFEQSFWRFWSCSHWSCCCCCCYCCHWSKPSFESDVLLSGSSFWPTYAESQLGHRKAQSTETIFFLAACIFLQSHLMFF